jgi:hypothetical protein
MNDVTRAAFHEAGHAVIAHRFNRAPRIVEISSDGTGNTICRELRAEARHTFSPARYRELAIEEVHVWSAGAIAEEIFTGTYDPSAARVDTEHVQFWLAELRIGSGTDRFGRYLAGATRRMLLERPTWAAMQAVASRLQCDGSLSGDELTKICRSLRVPRLR